MNKTKLGNISKRISIGLIAMGLVFASVGFFYRGLDTISFLFFK